MQKIVGTKGTTLSIGMMPRPTAHPKAMLINAKERMNGAPFLGVVGQFEVSSSGVDLDRVSPKGAQVKKIVMTTSTVTPFQSIARPQEAKTPFG
jgi:hypothetical protein